MQSTPTFPALFDQRQMREEPESTGSSKRREINVRLMNEKDPPLYGAQHRQDALWKGEQSHFDIRWVTQQGTRRR